MFCIHKQSIDSVCTVTSVALHWHGVSAGIRCSRLKALGVACVESTIRAARLN